MQETEPQAWISLPTDAEIQASTPPPRPGGYNFGFVPAMSKLILAHERIGAAFGSLYGHVMFAPGRLDRRERELVAAVAAAAQDCHY